MRPALVVLALPALLLTLLVACTTPPAARVPGAPTERAPAPSPVVAGTGAGDGGSPVALLRAWDSRRAEAWAAGDVGALRRLYVAGSVAGRRDTAMLRRWVGRGLRVEGLVVQVLQVRVLARGRGVLRLAVTERLAGAVAVPVGRVGGRVGGRAGGGARGQALPTGSVRARRIELRRTGAGWRVARVSVARGEA